MECSMNMSTTPKVLQTDIHEKREEYCPNCHNEQIIFDSSNGEMICISCGMIVEDRLDSSGIESEPMKNIENHLNVGMPLSLAHYDKGLSTTISSSNVDEFEIKLTQVNWLRSERLGIGIKYLVIIVAIIEI